jgi:microcystin-dependent protein
MASTYTNRLGLEKQTDGENPNSWGAILNTNVIDLIDDAIAGYEIVSVSSTGIVLSDSNGATDQSRNAALEFAGTLTANVTITIPSEEKTYFIRENTTGSFAVQMKTAAGNALTLSQGINSFIACDGTDIYELDSATSVNTFTANTLTATSITTSILAATDVSTTTLTATSITTSVVDASSITVTGNVSAAEYYGDGSNLTGIITPSDSIPSGSIFPYAGISEPSDYLFCYGQTINRTTYSDLFTAIGTTYGVGDGSTTFALPDLRGRVVAGQDDMGGSSANRLTGASGGVNGDVLGAAGGDEGHQLTEAELAAHTHSAGSYQTALPTQYDNEGNDFIIQTFTNQNQSGTTSFSITGSSGSIGSDAEHNNVQPTLILNYIIKT